MVAVCAGVGFMPPWYGFFVGLCAGAQFPFTLRFVEHRLKLDDAIGTARDVVRNIRAGRFEMSEDYPARFEDAFANICQTRVFGGGDDLETDA